MSVRIMCLVAAIILWLAIPICLLLSYFRLGPFACGVRKVVIQMGKSAVISGVFILLFALSAILGASALCLHYIPALSSMIPGLSIPFFSVSAICAVAASLLVVIFR